MAEMAIDNLFAPLTKLFLNNTPVRSNTYKNSFLFFDTKY